jgi:2'-5' RNA ligase
MQPVLFVLILLYGRLVSVIPSSSAFVAKVAYKTAQRSIRRMTATTSESPPKFHHFTVCLVPPEREERIWQILTRARTELRDAGFYRWPPHVNLLYPFCDPYIAKNGTSDNDVLDSSILRRLEAACRQVEPFQVQLNQFGTFGGSNRGVLWLHPSSSSESSMDAENAAIKEEPVMKLQRLLEDQFPFCNEQRLVGEDGGFKPHMTLSHFASRQEAQAAQDVLTSTTWWPKDDSSQFLVDEIYLMHRQGDAGGGQFKRIASLPLGENRITQLMEGPFQQMPTEEYEWVKEARKIMKRERNRRGRQRRSRGQRSPSPRVPDTPEVIAAKRAERKAKREASEQKQ